MLDWSGNCPDIDNIENAWYFFKKKLSVFKCTSKTELQDKIIEIWHHENDFKDVCINLVNSLLDRIKKVVENGGRQNIHLFHFILLLYFNLSV